MQGQVFIHFLSRLRLLPSTLRLKFSTDSTFCPPRSRNIIESSSREKAVDEKFPEGRTSEGRVDQESNQPLVMLTLVLFLATSRPAWDSKMKEPIFSASKLRKIQELILGMTESYFNIFTVATNQHQPRILLCCHHTLNVNARLEKFHIQVHAGSLNFRRGDSFQ